MDLQLLDADADRARARRRRRTCSARRPSALGRRRAHRRPTRATRARGGHDARSRRHLLLPALHALQEHAGWISPGGLNYVCRAARRAAGRRLRRGDVLRAARASSRARRASCTSARTSPAAATAREELIAQLEERVGARGRAIVDGATWLRSPCLGQCDRAPAAMLTIAGEEPERAACSRRSRPPRRSTTLAGDDVAERRCVTPRPAGRRPDRCGCCARRPRAIRRASTTIARRAATRRCAARSRSGREARASARSRTRSCSAAAAPPSRPGVKWEAVARQPARPHYLICNADESEPGTFKDRVIVEGDPFALIEAMTIAAYATGAEHGYVYLRGEYPRRAPRARRGARRGAAARLPRRRHPRRGLRRSTSRSARAPARTSAARRRRSSTRSRASAASRATSRRSRSSPACSASRPSSTTSRRSSTCSTSSSAAGPAFAEHRHRGLDRARSSSASRATSSARASTRCRSARRSRELLELAGGVAGGRELQTILLGGAAGGFVRPDELDLPLTFEDARAAQDDARLGRRARASTTRSTCRASCMRIAAFFRNESCGQCVPCRVGTVRQQEALARLVSGRTRGGAEAELRADRRDRPVHARRLDLRPRPDGVERHRVGDRAPRRLRRSRHVSTPRPSSCSRRSAWSSSRSTGRPCACSRGRRSSTPAASSGSTRRRCATARRCSPPTSAASASSSSRARACSRRPARARPRRA